jgi:hypothetical protein
MRGRDALRASARAALGGVLSPVKIQSMPHPSGQGGSSFGLTSAPQFPKNTFMVASLTSPKPPPALKTRKAISYP